MKGPERPHTMQTTIPSTTNAALASCSCECGSGKVNNAIRPCEDWSVTPTS
jgi:hypothetical protein